MEPKQDVRIYCESAGPVTWTKDGLNFVFELADVVEYLMAGKQTYILQFKGILPGISGVYQCEGNTTAGHVSTDSAEILVGSK